VACAGRRRPNLRWRDYQAIRDRRDLFTQAIAQSTRYVSSKGRPLAAELVSTDYFETLAPEMFLGRPLGPGDKTGNAVVLGYQAWAGLFARDAGAFGREIDLNGRPFVIAGVLAPAFAGLHAMPRDIWIPIEAYAAVAAPDLLGDGARAIDVSVRLRSVSHRSRRGGDAARRGGGRPRPSGVGGDPQTGQARSAVAQPAGAPLAGVRGIRARALRRMRQRVERHAGAGRRAATRNRRPPVPRREPRTDRPSARHRRAGHRGDGRGGLARHDGDRASCRRRDRLEPFLPLAAILRTAPLAVDHRVFLFTLAVAGASTLAFALVPALQASRPTLTGALGAHGGGGRKGARLRGALVAGQVATSLLLVVPALTLARNGAAMRGTDVGFDERDVLSINVRLGDEVDRVARLARVLESEPRVAHAAVTNGNPFFGPARTTILESQGLRVLTPYHVVSPEYFATLRIPLQRGRVFGIDESRTDARVAIVSAATARAFWPGQDPIGKTVRIAPSPGGELAGYSDVTVVGTAGDVISSMIVNGPEAGHLYLPTGPGSRHAMALLVRGRAPHDLAPEAVQQILKRAAPDPEVFEAVPLEAVRALQVYPFMAASWIGSLLGVIALALSVSGLFATGGDTSKHHERFSPKR
jgi:hypothetical protein